MHLDQEGKGRLQSSLLEREKHGWTVQDSGGSAETPAPSGVLQAQERLAADFHRYSHFHNRFRKRVFATLDGFPESAILPCCQLPRLLPGSGQCLSASVVLRGEIGYEYRIERSRASSDSVPMVCGRTDPALDAGFFVSQRNLLPNDSALHREWGKSSLTTE